MSSQALSEAAETTARYLIGPQFLSIFKGFTLTTIGPIILVVIFTVIVVNILAYLLADSPGPYPHYGKKLALAAADFWDKRDEYGFPTGRALTNLGPLESILDAIATSVKKYEHPVNNSQSQLVNFVEPAASEVAARGSQGKQDASASAPSNFIKSSPQFITKPLFQTQRRNSGGSSGGKIRFQ